MTNSKVLAEKLGLMEHFSKANIIKERKMDTVNWYLQMGRFMKGNFKWMKCRE